jgi:hypothetical protein
MDEASTEGYNENITFFKIYNVVDIVETEIRDTDTLIEVTRKAKQKKYLNVDNNTICFHQYLDYGEDYYNQDKHPEKISVYFTNTGEYIYEDSWYIKLSIKGDDKDQYIYINFIRTISNKLKTEIITKTYEAPIRDCDPISLEDNLKLNDNYKQKLIENITQSNTSFINSKLILDIIKAIASNLGIHKIVLQDDATFPCNGDLKYGIKAIQLRALNPENQNIQNLSIYGNKNNPDEGFKPTKYLQANDSMKGCIEALRKVNCAQLKKNAISLKKIISNIREKDENYRVFSMIIQEQGDDNLNINYNPVKPINYSSVCQQYIKNLDSLIKVLGGEKESKEADDMSIYEYYEKFCEPDDKTHSGKKNFKETDDCCTKRGDLLSCLKNSSNSYVIIIKSALHKEDRSKSEETQCEAKVPEEYKVEIEKNSKSTPQPLIRAVSAPVSQIPPPTDLRRVQSEKRGKCQNHTKPETKGPIIITKLFNLFYGTFEKLKYIYHHMELNLDSGGASAAPGV